MEIFVRRLFEELLADGGSEINIHPELSLPPNSQYKVVFSEENTRLLFEHELVDLNRPLTESIIMVGSTLTDEQFVSYAIPYDIDSESGAEWDRSGKDNLFQITSTVRITLISKHKAPKQAYAELHYMQLFTQNAIRNAPTRNWWEEQAHLVGFTSTFPLVHYDKLGMAESDIHGKWFGTRLRSGYIPAEHVAIRKL